MGHIYFGHQLEQLITKSPEEPYSMTTLLMKQFRGMHSRTLLQQGSHTAFTSISFNNQLGTCSRVEKQHFF